MSGNVTLDVDFARSFFPALNPSWSFLENAGGTLVPTTVVNRVASYMTETQVQPGTNFDASRIAAERMDEGREIMAAIINAKADEIVIGPSTTNNVYVLANALRPWFADGDEVIVTNVDHEANNGAWRRYADAGLAVREWRMDPETGELNIDDLQALLTDRTRLVCFTACSNITGSINDVAAIAKLVHDAGALVCVDGVAFTPHRAVDVKELDVDFYLYSIYKVFGPHAAILYGKPEHLARLENQNHYFVEGNPFLMLSPGGPNHELTAGAAGVGDYFNALYDHQFGDEAADTHTKLSRLFGLFADHEARLSAPLVDFLSARSNLRLFGPVSADMDKRAAVFSFVAEGRDSAEIAERLQQKGAGLRSGDFYAARCIDGLGVRPQNGVIRASLVHYNTPADVDRLIKCLDEEV
ncbi:MAG: aminotransferase class V-fold PLP-dependent enzyme [Rhodospirillales bacterium]|nr:aminotransferase class V-fold PLP-dependent enzyme [Rhodospirillales bacterium]